MDRWLIPRAMNVLSNERLPLICKLLSKAAWFVCWASWLKRNSSSCKRIDGFFGFSCGATRLKTCERHLARPSLLPVYIYIYICLGLVVDRRTFHNAFPCHRCSTTSVPIVSHIAETSCVLIESHLNAWWPTAWPLKPPPRPPPRPLDWN